MSEKTLNDLNVMNEETLVSPTELKNMIPASEEAIQTVRAGRQTIKKILDREDPRIFIVVGPCSIHDPTEALDYAKVKGVGRRGEGCAGSCDASLL